MVEAGIDFFFNIIKWVFNDFLIKIKIYNISLLYYFLAIMLLGFVISGLINGVSAGNWVNKASNSRRNRENEEMRQRSLKKMRSK